MRKLFRILLALATVRAVGQGYAVDPRAAADLVTQVNALAAACHYHCTIRIPAGEYTVKSGTIHLDHNGLSLVGDGRNNTIIHYAGLNFLDSRLNRDTYNDSFQGSGLVSGFTLHCTNPQAKCITSGSVSGQRWQDLTLAGPAPNIVEAPPPGAHAEGFVFQNTFAWMERTVFRDIIIGGFNVNFHFMAPAGGTDSFGYALFDGIWTNQGAGSRNFVVDAGASVYNVLGFSMQFNSGRTTTADEVFSIHGILAGVGFHVTGENSGAPITFAHIACGGRLNFEGDYNIFGGDIVADCAQSKAQAFAPFRVGSNVGLNGIFGSVGGNPVIAATTNLGFTAPQDLKIWPTQAFRLENPYQDAYTGFVQNADGQAAPISVFDAQVPWCVATRSFYTQPGEVTNRLCLNGAGDLAAAGSVRGTTVRTTRGTPANSAETCTPGESWDDDNFHYHCTSRGRIRRLALGDF